MASSKEYLDFVLEQLSEAEGVSYRAMMGEYVIYAQGKVVGGIYDDRFLVKPTPGALELIPNAPREIPYDGAKEMLLVEDIEDRRLMNALLSAIAADLPAPKAKKQAAKRRDGAE
ncbi:MAG: TfoX/Sxy family protein [Clostridia bacterium]|nr:TfoX/Sxy family protein [Clostridia bacterium]